MKAGLDKLRPEPAREPLPPLKTYALPARGWYRRLGVMAESILEPAKVFEDQRAPGDWRVEWENAKGEVEVTIFSCPDAGDRAILYANWRYLHFVQPRP